MDINKLNKIYKNKFSSRFSAKDDEFSRIVSGKSDSWEEIVRVCKLAVDKKSGRHVVNNINFTGGVPRKMRIPNIKDKSLDGLQVDVLVIGGGISGTSILRELSKWNIKSLLIDKEYDIALHATGRNDGEVHPGVDLNKGSLKQKYVIKANEIYHKVCSDLDVPFVRCGQVVGFFGLATKFIMRFFAWQRRVICGVKGTKIISGREVKEKEPMVNKDFAYGLYSPTAGCVCPYGLAIAFAENAVENGAEVSLSTVVLSMEVQEGKILSVETNRGRIFPKIVVNAAGAFADDVAEMAGDRYFSIHPRKGTNSITDRKSGALVNSITSFKTLLGLKRETHTKGGGILHTVDDNLLVGPDAKETFEKEDFSTSHASITAMFNKQRVALPSLSERDIITYFSGIRAPNFEEDFIVEMGKRTKNIVHCAAIQSPGLTTAPVVALDVEKLCIDYLNSDTPVEKNPRFNPIRKGPPRIRDMDEKSRSEMIAKNPDYGIIVCRCEQISKGEIIDALNSPIPVHSVDGVKRRVRPGMGRCQGGFCMPLVMKIISEHTGKPLSEITKGDENSFISLGKVKEKNL
ncbi:MAG: NAD(P)/FAD-dependent oxidoreductase [Spirochaetaceae bacterium]|nr:NAD(P)/FAD-dependent oxidoreductase [Spirochaetaceae bacterium]